MDLRECADEVMDRIFEDKLCFLGEVTKGTFRRQIEDMLVLLGAPDEEFGRRIQFVLSHLDEIGKNSADWTSLLALQDYLMEERSHPHHLALWLTMATVFYRCSNWVQHTMQEEYGHSAQYVSSALHKLEKCMRVMMYGVREGSKRR